MNEACLLYTSKIAQIEVEVVDETLYRVAGTGIFRQHVNEDMAQEGYVSVSYTHLDVYKRQVMRTRRHSGSSQAWKGIPSTVKAFLWATGITIPAECGYSIRLAMDFPIPHFPTAALR